MTLTNRIAKSSLITLRLEDYYDEGQIYVFDLKDFLWKELILKEKDFRADLDAFDWSAVKGKYVQLCCTADAIIPLWAYMLVATKASPFAKEIYYGDNNTVSEKIIFNELCLNISEAQVQDGLFVIKGCSSMELSPSIYTDLAAWLERHGAKSIMFGEACSTVPIFKKRK